MTAALWLIVERESEEVVQLSVSYELMLVAGNGAASPGGDESETHETAAKCGMLGC